MKTLQDAKDYISRWVKKGLLYLDTEAGGQGLVYRFKLPDDGRWVLQPDLRVFGGGKSRNSLQTNISSIAVTVGKTEEAREDRDKACMHYFGYGFAELNKDLSARFACKPGNKVQITCTKRASAKEFIDYVMMLRVRRLEHGKKTRAEGNAGGIADRASPDQNLDLETESPLSSQHAEGAFKPADLDPGIIEDERNKVTRAVNARVGQTEFREMLLGAYKSKCAISRMDVPEVLEAAHIIPYRGEKANVSANGLLLRSDLHLLFDRGLIVIDEEYRVHVAKPLRKTLYGRYHGQRITLPSAKAHWPSVEALRWRWHKINQVTDDLEQKRG